MANITCTWELGGGIGHAANLSALGILLQERGHTVSYILKNPQALSHFISDNDVNVAKAPRWVKKISGLPQPSASYSEILMKRGYLDPEILMGLCQHWQKLLLKNKPDLIIADYSPTAILAAYILSIKCVTYCNGFATPPKISPLPAFRKEYQNDMQRFIHGEKKIMQSVNVILKKFNRPTLKELADLFRYTSESFITTFPEMDPYQHRTRASYVGHTNQKITNHQSSQIYSEIKRKKIFVYLKNGYKKLKQALGHIQQLDADTIVYINKVANDIRNQFESENFSFSDKPLDISKVLTECDTIICHANHGTVLESLLAGTPLIMLPMVYEQRLTAMQVESLQAGNTVDPGNEDCLLQMQKVISDENYRINAKNFAKKHHGINSQETLSKVIYRCETLLTPLK